MSYSIWIFGKAAANFCLLELSSDCSGPTESIGFYSVFSTWISIFWTMTLSWLAFIRSALLLFSFCSSTSKWKLLLLPKFFESGSEGQEESLFPLSLSGISADISSSVLGLAPFISGGWKLFSSIELFSYSALTCGWNSWSSPGVSSEGGFLADAKYPFR